MLNRKKIKNKLEEEREVLLGELQDMGKLNRETNEWEATPEEQDAPESEGDWGLGLNLLIFSSGKWNQ